MKIAELAKFLAFIAVLPIGVGLTGALVCLVGSCEGHMAAGIFLGILVIFGMPMALASSVCAGIAMKKQAELRQHLSLKICFALGPISIALLALATVFGK